MDPMWTLSSDSFEYDFYHVRKTVEFIAEFYKGCKMRIEEEKPVPYLKAEDETAIEARPSYDEQLDCVWGFCGLNEKPRM